jgi:two-component system response regulator RegX3
MKLRLLVVEDDTPLRELLVLMLSDRGDTFGAATGEEGVALADRHGADVVLLDFMLPGLRGWDLLHAIRDRPKPPIVILITGYADDRLIAEAPGRGVFAVFGKPFSAPALLSKLEEAAALRREQLAGSSGIT